MENFRETPRRAYALVAAPAALGVFLGAAAYLGDDTGVDGTAGALLALFGAAAVTVAALVAIAPMPRGLRTTLNVLLVLGAVMTAFAAWMLMQPLFAAAMAASALGLVAALAVPRRRVAA
jgi:drug/metabolite transporter (DMT)-like permease